MDKKQFDEMYVGNKIAVYCPTQELVDEFLYLANMFGYNWNTKETTSKQKNLEYVYNKTFNSFDRMIADRYDKFVDGAIFKEFKSIRSDDMKDLRNLLQIGRVVENRDGSRAFVLDGKLIYSDGWDNLDIFRNDLTCENTEDGDIMRVYDCPVIDRCSWHFASTREDLLQLVWERKEFDVSEVEKTILKSLSPKHKYLARDEDGELCIYECEPYKLGNFWNVEFGEEFGETVSFRMFNGCFKYIKWEDEKPTLIMDLINS